MDPHLLGIFSVVSLVLLSAGTLLYLGVSQRRSSQLLEGLGSSAGSHAAVRELQTKEGEIARNEFEKLKEATRQNLVIPAPSNWHDRFFRAGIFSQSQRRIFQSIRIVLPCTLIGLGVFVGMTYSHLMALIGGCIGLAIGLQLPLSYLNRVIERRNEDIMYYLPLVIDQLVIGVSGSLDVSPCIRGVVAMADERDTHNPVTELLRFSQHYIKSGVTMEDALTEVGILSGNTELKHVFIALSQVAKHGGEISRQLQELANAVSQQRETKIEARVKKLELEATGPVGLVFLAFLGTLLVGIGTQMMDVLR